MARRAGWDNLSEGQRKRYLGYGRARGWSAGKTRREYETGKSLAHMRGKGSAEKENKAARVKRATLRHAYLNNCMGSTVPIRNYYGDNYEVVHGYAEVYGWPATLVRLEGQLKAIVDYRHGDKSRGNEAWAGRDEEFEGMFYYH